MKKYYPLAILITACMSSTSSFSMEVKEAPSLRSNTASNLLSGHQGASAELMMDEEYWLHACEENFDLDQEDFEQLKRDESRERNISNLDMHERLELRQRLEMALQEDEYNIIHSSLTSHYSDLLPLDPSPAKIFFTLKHQYLQAHNSSQTVVQRNFPKGMLSPMQLAGVCHKHGINVWELPDAELILKINELGIPVIKNNGSLVPLALSEEEVANYKLHTKFRDLIQDYYRKYEALIEAQAARSEALQEINRETDILMRKAKTESLAALGDEVTKQYEQQKAKRIKQEQQDKKLAIELHNHLNGDADQLENDEKLARQLHEMWNSGL